METHAEKDASCQGLRCIMHSAHDIQTAAGHQNDSAIDTRALNFIVDF